MDFKFVTADGGFVPLTDDSSNRMLHDPRTAALTGRTAALCQRVKGQLRPPPFA
jgi:hypothetical protein